MLKFDPIFHLTNFRLRDMFIPASPTGRCTSYYRISEGMSREKSQQPGSFSGGFPLAGNLRSLRLKFAEQRPEFVRVKPYTQWLGVPNSTYDSWEKGDRIPPAKGLHQIAEKTGVNLNWLLRSEGLIFGPPKAPSSSKLLASGNGTGIAYQNADGVSKCGHENDVTRYVPTKGVSKLDTSQVAEPSIKYKPAGLREQIMGQLRQAAAYLEGYDLVPAGERPRHGAGARHEAGPQVPPVLRIVPAAANAAAGDSLAEIEAESEHIVVVPILEAKVAAGAPRNIWQCEIEGWAFCYAAHVPHPKDTHCLRIAGDSMAPVIPAGALIGIDHAINDPRQMRTRLGHAPKALLRIEGEGSPAMGGAPACVVRNIKLVGEQWLMGTPENASGEFPEFTFDLAEPDTLNAVLGQVIWWFTSEL